MIGYIANTKEQLIDKIKRLKGYNIEMSIPPLHWIKIMASGGAAGSGTEPCGTSYGTSATAGDER